MSQNEKLLLALLSGRNDKNFSFHDLCHILDLIGGKCHIRGDHFIYTFPGIISVINIQPGKNGKAKPYQVKQVREFIQASHIGGDLFESI